jgi:hypothetical protein
MGLHGGTYDGWVKESFEPHVRTRCSGNAHKLVGYSVDASLIALFN